MHCLPSILDNVTRGGFRHLTFKWCIESILSGLLNNLMLVIPLNCVFPQQVLNLLSLLSKGLLRKHLGKRWQDLVGLDRRGWLRLYKAIFLWKQ